MGKHSSMGKQKKEKKTLQWGNRKTKENFVNSSLTVKHTALKQWTGSPNDNKYKTCQSSLLELMLHKYTQIITKRRKKGKGDCANEFLD